MSRSLTGTVCIGVLLTACTSQGDGQASVDAEPVVAEDRLDAAVDARSEESMDAMVRPRDTLVISHDGRTFDAYVVEVPLPVFRDLPPTSYPRCETGTTAACVCGDGSVGRQRCNDAGVWEFCQCGESASRAPGWPSQLRTVLPAGVRRSRPPDRTLAAGPREPSRNRHLPLTRGT